LEGRKSASPLPFKLQKSNGSSLKFRQIKKKSGNKNGKKSEINDVIRGHRRACRFLADKMIHYFGYVHRTTLRCLLYANLPVATVAPQ
jgi:hypothetical protein